MLVTKFSRCILQTNTATQTLITNHASLTKMLAKSMMKKPQKGTLKVSQVSPLLKNSC